MSEFFNPYHFVPVPYAQPLEKVDRPKQVDHLPENWPRNLTHDRYVAKSRPDAASPDVFSGTLLYRIETVSPLVVGGHQDEPKDKKSFRTIHPYTLAGRPAIPGSTLRGLFSSLAEAASNSALRVLDDRIYSRRQGMDESLSAIGMIVVESSTDGRPRLRLRPLALPTLARSQERAHQGYYVVPKRFEAAFPKQNYKALFGEKYSIRKSDFTFRTWSPSEPKYHGLEVQGPSEPMPWDSNPRRDENGNRLVYSRAHEWFHAPRGVCAIGQLPLRGADGRYAEPVPWPPPRPPVGSNIVRGILRVLGAFPRERRDDFADLPKKHEVFIPYSEEMESWPSLEIPAAVIDRFHALSDERTRGCREAPWLPFEPVDTRNRAVDDHRLRIQPGDLVYFDVDPAGTQVSRLSFSSIWRDRVDGLDGRPASTHAFFRRIQPETTPLDESDARKTITLAEQLFGFVEHRRHALENPKTGATLALAGRVRFSAATLSPSITHLEEVFLVDAQRDRWVPLKILASPKPPAPSFYFRPKKGSGYISKKDLPLPEHLPQGRKLYLHHPLTGPDGRKLTPWETQRPGEDQDQKARVRPIRPGQSFYGRIDFDNLRLPELQLLAYSVQPTPEFQHKLGLGRPIGLGSVRVVPLALLLVDRPSRYGVASLVESPRYHRVWKNQSRTPEDEAWPAHWKLEQAAESTQGEGDSNLFPSLVAGWRAWASRDFEIKDVNGKVTGRVRPMADVLGAIELLGKPATPHPPVHYPQVEGHDGAELEKECYKWFVLAEKSRGDWLHPLTAVGQDKSSPVLKPLHRNPGSGV